MTNIPDTFRDANYQPIKYDGSPIAWRVSLYGIHLQEYKILLVKHRDEKFWDVPGGGIEMGESLETALARESQEEAGWELYPLKPVTTLMDWFYHAGEKKFYRSLQMFWTASGQPLTSGPTDPKIEDVQLVETAKLDEFPIYPNLKQALSFLQTFPQS